MRVLRDEGGVHHGVHREGEGEVLGKVDLRSLLRGGEGGEREEGGEWARRSLEGAYERLPKVQQAWKKVSCSLPSGGHERYAQEKYEEKSVYQP